MKIEVALLLYNRPEHSLSVLRSLEENGVTTVAAYMDAPANPHVAENQDKMLRAIADIRMDVRLFRHSERQGLANSVRFAMSNVFETADAAILLEDDCVLRPGGLKFFTEGLYALRDDERVRSICGYLHPCNFVRGEDEPLLLRRFCTWGWATWRDRWQNHDPDLRAVLRSLQNQGLKVADFAADLAQLCERDDYLDSRVDIWSVPWILEHYATRTFAAYPCDSMIENIGFDGSGNNCEVTADFDVQSTTIRPWAFEKLAHYWENDQILQSFLDRNGLKTYPTL